MALKNKRKSVFIIIVIILFILVILSLSLFKKEDNAVDYRVVDDNISDIIDDTVDKIDSLKYTKFESEEYQFSFKYPSKWKRKEVLEYGDSDKTITNVTNSFVSENSDFHVNINYYRNENPQADTESYDYFGEEFKIPFDEDKFILFEYDGKEFALSKTGGYVVDSYLDGEYFVNGADLINDTEYFVFQVYEDRLYSNTGLLHEKNFPGASQYRTKISYKINSQNPQLVWGANKDSLKKLILSME